MKITEVISTILKSYEYPHGGWMLVRVKTDEGLEGIGECFVPDQQGHGILAAQAVLEGSLKRVLIGVDPLDIEVLWELMYGVCRGLYDRRGLAIHALSGVDMALYDLAGKALGVPVHKLLGGCFRDKVKVYVSSVWVDEERPQCALDATVRYVAQGFRAIKYYGWASFGHNPKRDSSLLKAIRQAAGEGIDLMLDLGRPASLAEATKMARMIEASGAGIYWWEEPLCSSDDAEGLARLAAATDLTIAAGERELTAFAFRDLILKRTVDLLQPDLSWVGGLTEGRRIAEMARLCNMPLVPHNWGTMVNFAASVHLVASMPQGFLCEYPIAPRTPEARIASPMMTELVRTPLAIENGYAVVPKGPGLGIELDEGTVHKYTWAE